jgi:carbonyl reductase 1
MSFTRIGVVTGANKGVGLGAVRQLALQYPKSPINNKGRLLLYLTARDESRGKDALAQLQADEQLKKAKALTADGGLAEIRFAPLDIGSKDSVETFFRHLKKEHPDGIDFIINNAAIAMDGFDINVVKTTLGINYYATLHETLAVADLIRPGGRIVNVASTSGFLNKYAPDIKKRFIAASTIDDATALMEEFTAAVADGTHAKKGWPSAAYAVSKAGVIAMTRALAQRFEREGRDLTINSCCPGWVVTDMTKGKGHKTWDQGAQTPIMLATEDIGGRNGGFWRDEKEIDWPNT